MAADPPFRFQNTTWTAAKQYLTNLHTFEGFSEAAILRAEERVGGRFPEVYRAFLRRMGRRSGELFQGSDLIDLDHPEETEEVVREILSTSPGFVLPSRAHVLLTHQGYSFEYTRAEGEFDAPVCWFNESNTASGDLAPSFAELLDQNLLLMEKLHQDQHETGGYSLEIDEEFTRQTHPARAGGERPLDQSDYFVDTEEAAFESSRGTLFRKFTSNSSSKEE